MSVFLGGYSEQGHDKAINQDAFRFKRIAEKNLAYIIVADGLGSCAHSDEGADTVTRIVEQWIKEDLGQYGVLSESIGNILARHVIDNWRKIYSEQIRIEYDTTVHFAIWLKDKVMVGGVGDGMLLVEQNGYCGDYVSKGNFFSNVTNSMCSENIDELFSTEVIEKSGDDLGIIIATDGIADDILSEKKVELPAYFRDIIQSQNQMALNAEIEDWLENWETEGHCDDKTICYLIASGEKE